MVLRQTVLQVICLLHSSNIGLVLGGYEGDDSSNVQASLFGVRTFYFTSSQFVGVMKDATVVRRV